ncbi:MAG: alpha/beta hydrolase [Armatimonadetes bacterium]|nr:alpha/beta hydrolase [Armatimonadota bacterium]
MDSGSLWLEERSSGLANVVFLQGWAHDWRIMSRSAANVNRIYVRQGVRRGFGPKLARFLKKSIAGPVTIVGWSLGGFAAVDFAMVYPELVKSLVLVGIRRSYTPEEIQITKDELTRDRRACLKGFYRRNFLPSQRRDWSVFKADLMESYLNDMDSEHLMAGLDYLATAQIDKKLLATCPTLIVHGRQDVIASAEEASQLAQEANVPVQIIEEASHAAFLHGDFSGILEKWLK